jgi:hypothetical protein
MREFFRGNLSPALSSIRNGGEGVGLRGSFLPPRVGEVCGADGGRVGEGCSAPFRGLQSGPTHSFTQPKITHFYMARPANPR